MGKLQESDYLLSSPERISYVTNTLTGDETSMVFLYRLEDPVILKDGEKEIRLIYYGTSYNMKELNPYFSCSAYNGNNCVYVIDSQGLKLFRSSSSGAELLQGYNTYTVLKNMEYLHGSSFEEALKELEANGTAYSNAILDGKEYYYALYHMDNSEWTLLFLVDSDYVATNTVALVNVTVRYIMFFSVVLVAVCCVLIFSLLRLKQKQIFETERKNSEKLSQINRVLDQKNTELERAVAVAEDASRAKSDFLANMSHDIRTPMNAIVGITSLMEHESNVSDKLHSYIDKVQLSSRHLLGLINDVLDMSRIESKEVKLNKENVSLAEEIGQVDSIIRAQANERNQKFHIHVNGIVHEYLLCDGVRLRQIMLNLLSNAVKYTANGGDITLDFAEVSCPVPDHAAFICIVTDNGYGMTPEFVEHIFEPFTRAESSVTNKVQGTGLGMAITKNIVDLMGGEIHVDSELGRGSRFEVKLTLPVDTSKEHLAAEKRILLVSGDKRLVQNIKASVSETEIEFCAVSTVEEAAGWLTQEDTDVILISGCVNNGSLKETVHSLRKMAENATLIFCVDYIQNEQIEGVIAGSGVDGIICRPFFLSNLETAVARVKTEITAGKENDSILHGMKFLCAEDNELNAEILKEILQMYDAECTIYPNGEEIVQAFENIRPGEYDAILMDIQMPKMNGLDATRAIRNGNNPLGKTIPIIAMTANAFSEDVQKCMGAGMDAHIAKPLDIAVLEKTLRGFVSGGGR